MTAPTKVELVANLLQVNQEELLTCLTTETMYTRGMEGGREGGKEGGREGGRKG